MFKKVAFTKYPVADMARARHFYEKRWASKSAKCPCAARAAGWNMISGRWLLLHHHLHEIRTEHIGGTISFEVDDIEHLVGDLKAKGVTFVSEMIQSPVCRMAVCLDSEGNSLLLHQLKPKEAEASTSWLALASRRLNRVALAHQKLVIDPVALDALAVREDHDAVPLRLPLAYSPLYSTSGLPFSVQNKMPFPFA
jgi:predicted enzyme related to lactoylglutathione lyase